MPERHTQAVLATALGSLLATQPLPAGDPDRLVITGHGREPSRVLLRPAPAGSPAL